MTHPIVPSDDELERLLHAYADARLSPDPGSIAATRARVVRDAEFAMLAAREAGADRAVRARARRMRWGRFGVRYGLLAASLTMIVAVAGVSLASSAGDPLYGVRVWFEDATLPGAGDARASAELGRLDARMLELAAAVDSGDGPGAVAAAAAYRAILEEALAGAVGDDRREMQLENALSRHVAVLTALLENVPAPARGAIEHAIGASDQAIDKIGSQRPRPGQSGGEERPGSSARPDKSQKPGKPGG